MTHAMVYVIDDHKSVRAALGEMLGVFGFEVETFASAQGFLDIIARARPGCVVADVRMPGMDGIELVREFRRRGARFPVVLISGHADVPMAVAAIKAGAEDFIEKPVDDAQLVAAINRSFDRLAKSGQDQVAERFTRLTPREVEVFDLVVQGCTSAAIAERLAISIRTVESYRVQIGEKMQADGVATLVRQAIRLGRLSP
jgi:two-component system response regulator FixJ